MAHIGFSLAPHHARFMQHDRFQPDDALAELAALRRRIAELEGEVARWRALAVNPSLDGPSALLTAVLNQLPVGVSIAEAPSGRLLAHNDEAVRLLGHPLRESADYAGYAQYGALHPDGRPYSPEEYPIARALLHAQLVPFEDMRYRRGDGSLTTFAVNAAPITDEHGHMIAVASTFHNVEHQRQLEIALRESEGRFAAAFHASPVAMVISAAADGRILDVNERFLTLFGRDRADVIGQPSTALGMWDDPADRERTIAHMRREGRVRDWEVRIRGAHDVRRHVLLSVEPLQLAGVPGLLTALYDITDRVRAAAAIQQSEALYRAIIGALPGAGVLVVDAMLRCQVAEGPALALLGLTQQRVMGRTPAEVLDAETADAAMQHFRQALAGAAFTVERTYNGHTLWVRYTPLASTVDDPSTGSFPAALALVLDITERKRLEALLLQAQKMESIGQLAGGIAHDFNNLLTAIGGYAELAVLDLPQEARIQDHLREILRAADRAAALTRQLLTFARRQPMELRSLWVNEVVTGLTPLLRRLLGEHIELATDLDAAVEPVVADRGQIEQVLMNLVVNARDAMPEGGKITITTANIDLDERFAHGHVDLPAGRYVLLAVSDTGIGIPPELQPHLFEPFFTTKPVGQGTGLGLATSYGIVKQHGGTIWLYSEVGQGTVVKVYLPRDGSDVEPSPSEASATELPCGTETILLAEDEPAVRALAARLLRECGYTVLEASDGAEAVRLAASHAPQPINLFLSDVVMPNLGGPAAAAAIRTFYPDIAVLYISGYLGTDHGQGAAPAIDAPLLQKPFTSLRLTLAIRVALER